ncbi:WD40-repeat-containing domain protein [Scleroderma yunnanense]
MESDEIKPEIIDIDELDLVCTGVRHIVRIDRPPSPRARKNKRRPKVIDLVDSDDDENVSSTSSSRTGLPAAHATPSPSKKQATSSVRALLNRPGRYALKRKVSTDTIDIPSDDEDITPVKRTKLEDSVCEAVPPAGLDWDNEHPMGSPEDQVMSHGDIIDSEDDCVNFLASLDISDDANWLPLPTRNRAEDLTPEHVPTRAPNRPPFDAAVPVFRSVISYDRLYSERSSQDKLSKMFRMFGTARYHRPFYQSSRRDAIPLTGCVRSPKLYYDLAYDKTGIIAKHPHLTSGAVSKIIQAPGKIVIGAAALAGGAEHSDDEDQPLSHENMIGTLVVYNHGYSKPSVGGNYKYWLDPESVHKVQGHCHTRVTHRGPTMKYFCVNDVAFNPNDSSQFLSTGHDFSAQVWEIPDDGKSGKRAAAPRQIRSIHFGDVPQNIVYNDDGSLLAIPCTDGTVPLYITSDIFEDGSDTPVALHAFRVAPNKMNQAAGETVWGRESTKNYLFTSSESSESEDADTGYHRAWDTHKLRMAYELDAKEPGNAMTITPDGSTLVLITEGPGPRPLRLYDVRRRDPHAYETEELEPLFTKSSSSNSDGNRSELVDCPKFSPDGRLLAVGRADNRLHVYDIRALSKGPLCKFEHHDSDVGGGAVYGIIEAVWVEGRDRRRIGILSGGNDGCVRLWEPSLASGDDLQGVVIGRTDFDVAHFSIGDGFKGEMPIVIGDSGGGVNIYDLMDGEGCAIGRSWK